MPRERDEGGRIVETYSLDTVEAALETVGPAGTREVADELGSSYETAYHKLRKLEDEGRVSSRKVANARLWSLDRSVLEDRIESVIINNHLADLYHGPKNVPRKERQAAAILAEQIAAGRSPWKLLDDGGVIELPSGGWVEVDYLLSPKICEQIEAHKTRIEEAGVE